MGLSETLNAELAPRGIYVCAVCPGFINTPIIAAVHLQGELSQHRDRIQRFYERFGSSPDVVAEAVVDAIRRRKIIRTVPRHHVILNWAFATHFPAGGATARTGEHPVHVAVKAADELRRCRKARQAIAQLKRG